MQREFGPKNSSVLKYKGKKGKRKEKGEGMGKENIFAQLILSVVRNKKKSTLFYATFVYHVLWSGIGKKEK